MPKRKSIYRFTLYSLTFFFPFWLYYLSNVLMWTYTPFPRKLAISIVAVILPALLYQERTIVSIILAVLLAIIIWLPMTGIWMEPFPYGYAP